MTETKVSDKAAQARKKSADDQAKAAGPLGVRDDVEDTPTASEILADDKNKVFGENPEHQFQDRPLTADQVAVAKGEDQVHEPAEGAPKIGERVIMHSATPIGGQLDVPAIVIGYSPTTGNPNLRLEFTDGSRANGAMQEYGNVPRDVALEERGNFYRMPEDFAHKADDKK